MNRPVISERSRTEQKRFEEKQRRVGNGVCECGHRLGCTPVISGPAPCCMTAGPAFARPSEPGGRTDDRAGRVPSHPGSAYGRGDQRRDDRASARAGYHVAEPNEKWETPREFLARLGLRNYDTFHTALERWEARGHKLPTSWSPQRRRLVELVSNPEFDAFCRGNKKQHS